MFIRHSLKTFQLTFARRTSYSFFTFLFLRLTHSLSSAQSIYVTFLFQINGFVVLFIPFEIEFLSSLHWKLLSTYTKLLLSTFFSFSMSSYILHLLPSLLRNYRVMEVFLQANYHLNSHRVWNQNRLDYYHLQSIRMNHSICHLSHLCPLYINK